MWFPPFAALCFAAVAAAEERWVETGPMAHLGGDEMTEMHDSLKNMMGQMMAQGGDRPTAKQLTVAEWLPLVAQEIADDLIDMEQVS